MSNKPGRGGGGRELQVKRIRVGKVVRAEGGVWVPEEGGKWGGMLKQRGRGVMIQWEGRGGEAVGRTSEKGKIPRDGEATNSFRFHPVSRLQGFSGG